MDANEYQRQAARTLIDDGAVPTFALDDLAAIVALVKLSIELGDHLDRLKKRVFHQHPDPLPETTPNFLRHLALRAEGLGTWLDTNGPAERTSFQALQG